MSNNLPKSAIKTIDKVIKSCSSSSNKINIIAHYYIRKIIFQFHSRAEKRRKEKWRLYERDRLRFYILTKKRNNMYKNKLTTIYFIYIFSSSSSSFLYIHIISVPIQHTCTSSLFYILCSMLLFA